MPKSNTIVPDLGRRIKQFRQLSEEWGFSLVPLQGKRPLESNWNGWCLEKRQFNPDDFAGGLNAGVCCGPASRILVVDIDNEKLYDDACEQNGWDEPATFTVKTGGGGFHLYFRYPGDGKTYGNKTFKDWGFDIRGTGGQVVAPGSIHPVTGKPYTVFADLEIVDPPQWLLDFYEEDRPLKSDPSSVSAVFVDIDRLGLSKRILDLIRVSKPVGERSEAMMAVIDALVAKGLSDGEIEDVFESFPIGEKYREKGASKERWLKIQIEKARKYVADNKSTSPERTIETLEDRIVSIQDFLTKDIPPPEFIVHPWLTTGSLSMIYGQRGVGKSWFAMVLGLCVARGQPKTIGPWEVKEPAGVLYFDGEMSQYVLRERLSQLIPDSEKPHNPFDLLSSSSFSGKGLASPSLTNPDFRQKLYKYLEKHKDYWLLILDNISSLAPGLVENSKDDWDPINQWLLQLRHLDMAVVLIHHAGKNSFRGSRGTSGREDALDNVIQLKHVRKDSDSTAFQVAFTKNRNVPPGKGLEPFVFTIKTGVDESKKTFVTWSIEECARHAPGTKGFLIRADLLQGELKQVQIAKKYAVNRSYVTQTKNGLIEEELMTQNGTPTRKGLEWLANKLAV